jgi:hypothetical protein
MAEALGPPEGDPDQPLLAFTSFHLDSTAMLGPRYLSPGSGQVLIECLFPVPGPGSDKSTIGYLLSCSWTRGSTSLTTAEVRVVELELALWTSIATGGSSSDSAPEDVFSIPKVPV